MTKDSGDKGRYRDETLLSVMGRDPAANHGVVNPPVYHASTILHETAAALREATFGPRQYGKTYYGRYGTPTTFPAPEFHRHAGAGPPLLLVRLRQGRDRGGDARLREERRPRADDRQRLWADAEPRERAAQAHGGRDRLLRPCIGAGIADLMQGNTSVVVGESPGSLTFEVQDFPALAAAAQERAC